jgi:phage minor structural protein
MSKMLNVFDRATRKKTAVLQNAYDIEETQEINQIYLLRFTLPSNDDKAKYCLPRHFVRYGDTGQLYRIKSPVVNDSSVGTITYECEHVITTLCDDIMFGSFTYGGRGVYTADTIGWLLNQQKTQNWRLGTCAFSRQFEYNWEQENLLNALYSIPKEFAASYMWTFDTVSYPWTLNLVEIDKTAPPEYYLRARSNILSSGTSADYANICTRIYPLGYGEGVNQLTIRDATVTNVVKSGNVNVNGVPSETSTTKYNNTYIQSPQSYIDKYGIVEKVLVDRRFEQANSLFGYAKSMLEVYQEPTMSRSFNVTDLYPITNKPLDDAQVGKICKMTKDNTIAYITKTIRRWDQAGDLQIDLSTKASDIASNVADLADRIRIESVYAQGATQLYQHSKDANATQTKGMIMSLYFPSEMRQINKVLMRLKLGKFRAYSQTDTYYAGGITSADNVNTEDGGAITTSNGINTEAGGSYDGTSGLGGAITADDNKSTGTGGAITAADNKKTGIGGAITADDNKSTGTGGAISTQSGSGGGGSGQTGVASGGGGISLTPKISVSVTDTGDANWNQRPYTSGADLDVSISSSGSGHNHSVWGNTGTVTPPESDNYRHDHAINFATDGGGEGGTHTHAASIVNPGGEDTHNHSLTFNSLKHNHPVNASVSIQVNNTGGYSGFSHSHSFYYPAHSHTITIPGHSHQITLSGHSHQITLGGHRHSITLSGHRHKITLPAHKHKIIIQPHKHEIVAGIYEYGDPTAFTIYVDSKEKVTVEAKAFNDDITPWLLNEKNMIPRDKWIDVEIRPNDLAYVQASVFVQGFVQSRGGGNY